MIPRVLGRLPLLFSIFVPVAYVGFFVASLWTHPAIETTYDALFRLGIYVPYAVFVTLIFGGKVLLCHRTPDGRVAMWLVTVTYATGIFSMTLWAINALLIINIYHLSLGATEQPGLYLRAVANAFVGGGMIGEGIAAAVIVYGFRTNTLGRRIYPWVWQHHSTPEEETHVEP